MGLGFRVGPVGMQGLDYKTTFKEHAAAAAGVQRHQGSAQSGEERAGL